MKWTDDLKHKGSELLTLDENKQVFRLLDEKCLALATTVIELYDIPQWSKKDVGILCLVQDFNKQSFFFRLYCLFRKTLIWEQEIYYELKYCIRNSLVHTLQSTDQSFALRFSNEVEANCIRELVSSKLNKVEVIELDDNTNRTPTPGTSTEFASHTNPAKNNTSKSDSKLNPSKRSKFLPWFNRPLKPRKKSVDKTEIGIPKTFRHVSHFGTGRFMIPQAVPPDTSNVEENSKVIVDGAERRESLTEPPALPPKMQSLSSASKSPMLPPRMALYDNLPTLPIRPAKSPELSPRLSRNSNGESVPDKSEYLSISELIPLPKLVTSLRFGSSLSLQAKSESIESLHIIPPPPSFADSDDSPYDHDEPPAPPLRTPIILKQSPDSSEESTPHTAIQYKPHSSLSFAHLQAELAKSLRDGVKLRSVKSNLKPTSSTEDSARSSVEQLNEVGDTTNSTDEDSTRSSVEQLNEVGDTTNSTDEESARSSVEQLDEVGDTTNSTDEDSARSSVEQLNEVGGTTNSTDEDSARSSVEQLNEVGDTTNSTDEESARSSVEQLDEVGDTTNESTEDEEYNAWF